MHNWKEDVGYGSAILVTGNTKHYPDEPGIMTPAIFADILKSRKCNYVE
jgi:hypothetical protein